MSDKPTNVSDLIASFIASKEFIFAALGGVIGFFLSPLGKWIAFEKKKIQIENRKEKVRLWREELNKYDTLSDFYKTPLYNELVGYIPEEERDQLLNNRNFECTIGGAVGVYTSTAEDRIFARFHKVISDKEKEWNII